MTEQYIENFDIRWRHIIIQEDGSINLDQVMRELSDYSLLMECASKVYSNFTPISEPFTEPDVVIEHIEEFFRDEKAEAREMLGAIILDNLDEQKLAKISQILQSQEDSELLDAWTEVSDECLNTREAIESTM